MPIPVISFYSYKGGSGRSVCAANTVGYLAEKLKATPEAPLLVLDLDIDSAGITSLLSDPNKFDASDKKTNVKELFLGSADCTTGPEREKFTSSLVDISKKVLPASQEGVVLLLGNTLNGRGESIGVDNAGAIYEILTEGCRIPFKAIILDSASGMQSAAQVAHDISDVMVYCMRVGKQHRIGTEHMIENYGKSYGKEDDGVPFSTIVLPVAVPPPCEEMKIYQDRANIGFDKIANSQYGKVSFIEKGVPEVLSLKWEETVLAVKEKTTPLMDDEKVAVDVYKTLVDEIVEIVKPLIEDGNTLQ